MFGQGILWANERAPRSLIELRVKLVVQILHRYFVSLLSWLWTAGWWRLRPIVARCTMKTCAAGGSLHALRTSGSGTWLGDRRMAEDWSGKCVELSRGGRLGAGRTETGSPVLMQLSSIYIPDTHESTATETLQGIKCKNIHPIKTTDSNLSYQFRLTASSVLVWMQKKL